jgi:hypothetical protein
MKIRLITGYLMALNNVLVYTKSKLKLDKLSFKMDERLHKISVLLLVYPLGIKKNL